MSVTNPSHKKQVFSGMQPTGNLHLGRYFGAIQNWVNLQDTYKCIYCVVDYHAMTMPFEPQDLRQRVWNLVFDALAVGVKPENLFIQSMVPEHTELAWIFNCVSSYGDVSRMTQFKDKSQQVNAKTKDAFISTGLFAYPVLQAADILIYKADYVPVGNDQDQHLELTRSIAHRFNQIAGKEYFVLPETLYTSFPKVLSTADPSKKMSASLGPKHNISVFSEPNVIRKQIKSAVTDSGDTPAGQISPGVQNLLSILLATGGHPELTSFEEKAKAGTLQYGPVKEAVADAVISMTEPFRQKRIEIMEQRKSYEEQIAESSKEIRKIAQQTLHEVKDLIGLMNVKP